MPVLAVVGEHSRSLVVCSKLLVCAAPHSEARPRISRWLQDAALSLDAAAWIARQPLTIALPALGVLVVHAGLVPGVPLAEQRYEDMLWMRDVREAAWTCYGCAECASPEDGLVGLRTAGEPGAEAWASRWQGPEHVVSSNARNPRQRSANVGGRECVCGTIW